MFDITYRVSGYNRVRNSYRKLASAHADVIDPLLYRWGQRTRPKLKGTPAPPRLAHFKHVRTGRMQSSFRVERVATGRIIIRNSAYYSGYVISRQKRKHPSFRRWYIMEEIIDNELAELRQEITDELDKI